MGKKASHEVDHHEDTVAAKRNGRVTLNQRVTLTAKLLAPDTSHQNIVGNIQKRSIVEEEDLPVHHHIMNGRVRRTENVRHE